MTILFLGIFMITFFYVSEQKSMSIFHKNMRQMTSLMQTGKQELSLLSNEYYKEASFYQWIASFCKTMIYVSIAFVGYVIINTL